MTTTNDVTTRKPVRAGDPGRSYVREVAGAACISLMWLAVLFTGVYGGDAVFIGSDGSSTHLPSAAFVAFFAFLASASVAKRAFWSSPTSSNDRS